MSAKAHQQLSIVTPSRNSAAWVELSFSSCPENREFFSVHMRDVIIFLIPDPATNACDVYYSENCDCKEQAHR
jgi:hypothetical protein